MEQIVSIDQIERQARLDAQRYSDVNAACPHPFHTAAGRLYRKTFEQARDELKALAKTEGNSK